MTGGFIGKILKVDLTCGRVREEELDERFYKMWLGGYGLGARILYDEIPPRTDPLGPDNMLGFTTGILTGAFTPLGSSLTVVGKSPLTGTWGDSRAGGYFGAELRFAGFDAVFFHGRSAEPAYLWVNDGRTELRRASHLWGKDVTETEDALKEENRDSRVQVVSIGPAGERRSLISGVVTDKGRVAARSGLGAVMGSKNLKAIAVRGSGRTPVADSERLMELRKRFIDLAREEREFYWDYFGKYGTSGATAMLSASGDSPCKNWSGAANVDFPNAERVSDDNVVKYVTKKYGCHGCPMPCGGYVKVESGPYASEGMKPEYETLSAFGSLLLNDNVEAIMLANDLCNRYGLDTISTGATIAFAVECYQSKLITKEDTGGVELSWSDPEGIIKLVRLIGEREDFGAVLADGVRVASGKIGRGSERFAIHVGGQELPMHDPKLTPTYGSGYLLDATPGRHTQGFDMYLDSLSGVKMPPFPGAKHDAAGKGAGIAHMAFLNHVVNSLGVCQFPSSLCAIEGIPSHADFVNAVTGWNMSMAELLTCGERIACMRQAFNVREGFTPAHFRLPTRAEGKPPLAEGPLRGVTVNVENWVREYYRHADWDCETGRPSRQRLTALGLGDVAESLYGA